MSRVYFHSPSGEAELWGGEFAHLRVLVAHLAIGVLQLDHEGERLRAMLRPGHDLAAPRYRDPAEYLRWRRWTETALQVGNDLLAWNGHPINEFQFLLNTAAAAGSDSVKLACRLAGQAEIHAWCDGPDREWLAGLIDCGLADGVFRDISTYGPAATWQGVTRFLRERDNEPVVLSYSVEDSFPNQHIATWTPPDRDPAWRPEWAVGAGAADWDDMDDDTRADYWDEHASEQWYELPAAELLAIVGRELYRRAIGPDPLYQRMTNPRPGDLVLEVSSFGAFDPDSIGRLVEIEGGRYGDDADRYVVEPLHRPGVQQGWRNASFVALTDRRRWLDAAQADTPGAPPS